MIFRRFPYTTLNDINLDWIIKQVKQIAAALQGKLDKPDLPGGAGQVLGLDENLDPVWLDHGGGGGGTTNYNSLSNKPQINGVTLTGNKTAAELGIVATADLPSAYQEAPTMNGVATPGTTLKRFAMGDHVHPTDTSRAAASDVTAISEKLASFSHDNALDNAYFVGGGSQLAYGRFPVNQLGYTTYNNPGPIFDRWRLVDGTATLAAEGLVLNGTITQTLLTSIGQPYTARALLSDGTLINPTYDDSTRVFTLTATGQTIQAAKLERGLFSTIVDANGVLTEIPKFDEMLARCQVFRLNIAAYTRTRTTFYTGSLLDFEIPTPCTMRAQPTIEGALHVSNMNGQEQTGFTFEVRGISPTTVRIRATKANHGLTDGFIDSINPWFLVAEI